MNTGEKIAGTYLRLNGFLLLPQFTIFNEPNHNHIDHLAVRLGGSVERVFDKSLPVDEDLFDIIGNHLGIAAKQENLGAVVQVKTNTHFNIFHDSHLEYARSFLGNLPNVVPISFCDAFTSITIDCRSNENGDIGVGLKHAVNWIAKRVEWMDAEIERQKMASWTWSEDFLADILVLRKLKVFTG